MRARIRSLVPQFVFAGWPDGCAATEIPCLLTHPASFRLRKKHAGADEEKRESRGGAGSGGGQRNSRADPVAVLGFDESFRRLWTLCLACSEARFRSAYPDVRQIQLTREEEES